MAGKKRRGRSKGPTGPTTTELLKRSLTSYARAFPSIALVGLAGGLPMQLLVVWLLLRQGIQDDAVWVMRYQGIADWILGSLIAAALYRTIHRSIAEGPPRASELTGRLGWAYRRALGVWLGMFLTRMMVSFAVMIPGLPILGGLYLLGQRWPLLFRLVSDPGAVSELDPAMLLWLLAMVPLLALPMFFYLRYQLADTIVSLERTDGFEAMQRSKQLTTGAKWKLLWGVIVLGLPIELLWLLLSGLGDAIDPWAGALGNAIGMVLAALPGTFLVQVYLSQGGDAQDRRRVAAGAESPEA
jgi:hypothetical protein